MSVLERILGIILPVLFIVAAGYLYAWLRPRTAKLDMASMNRVSMEVLCPLLLFTALAGKDFDLAHNGTMVLVGIAVSLGSGLLAWPVARLLGYDARTFLPPMIFNNCGNMGLPLALLAFGATGLPMAAALFVAGTLVFFSVGIKILESGRTVPHTSFFTFLLSPMMIAILVGMIFSSLRIPVPVPLFTPLKMMGDACIPIMLFALGVRMIDVNFKCWRIGLVGAILCPVSGLLVALVLDHMLTLTALQRGQMYLFASLPPAVLTFMVAEQYQQEPDKVAAIVLLGNLGALAFVPLGLWLGLRAA